MNTLKYIPILLIMTLLALAPAGAQANSPPDNYVDLLFTGEQADWPTWKKAVVRSGALDEFKAQCEAGTLPWVSSGRVSSPAPIFGKVRPISGFNTVIDPFPMSDFAYHEPQKWGLIEMLLTDDNIPGIVAPDAMGFGVYCMFVSPTIDVQLICNTPDRYPPCSREEIIELEPGFTWLLVHDGLGVASGSYTVKTRCHDRTDTCAAGGVTGIYYRPDRGAGAFVPSELRNLLANPTRQ